MLSNISHLHDLPIYSTDQWYFDEGNIEARSHLILNIDKCHNQKPLKEESFLTSETPSFLRNGE